MDAKAMMKVSFSILLIHIADRFECAMCRVAGGSASGVAAQAVPAERGAKDLPFLSVATIDG